MAISTFNFTEHVVITCHNDDCSSHIRGLVTSTPTGLYGAIHWPPAWSLHEFWGLGDGIDTHGSPHVEVLYQCTICGTSRVFGHTTWAKVGLTRFSANRHRAALGRPGARLQAETTNAPNMEALDELGGRSVDSAVHDRSTPYISAVTVGKPNGALGA